MLVHAADQHAVLFDEAEARGCFARAREDAGVARGAHELQHVPRLCGDAGAAGEGVEGDALAEEELACGAAHGGDGFDGCEGGAFGEVPFDAAGRGGGC